MKTAPYLVALVAVYLSVSLLVFSIRHPRLTQAEVWLHALDALQWKRLP